MQERTGSDLRRFSRNGARSRIYIGIRAGERGRENEEEEEREGEEGERGAGRARGDRICRNASSDLRRVSRNGVRSQIYIRHTRGGERMKRMRKERRGGRG